jgi:hypothetical protein
MRKKTEVILAVENKEFERSFKRFFKYILDLELLGFKEVQKVNNKIILFVEENIKITENFWNLIQNNENRIKIVILGIKKMIEQGYINLLDLSKFKSNLISEINDSDYHSYSLLFVKEIGGKVSKFFKGHGEISLFKSLNDTIYYLKNGFNLLILEEINKDDFKELFFNPGKESWETLKKRFNKYKKYLKVCGFGEKIIQIEDNISKFQKFFEGLKSMNHNMLKKMGQKGIDLKLSYLKDIDVKFMDIKNIVDDYLNE